MAGGGGVGSISAALGRAAAAIIIMWFHILDQTRYQTSFVAYTISDQLIINKPKNVYTVMIAMEYETLEWRHQILVKLLKALYKRDWKYVHEFIQFE